MYNEKKKELNMDKILIWFADSKLASFLRTFAASVIVLALADFQKSGSFDFSNLEAWVIAALVSAVPPFLRYLNPQDTLS